MIYDIEFLRRIDGQAEAVALDVVRLVGDGIDSIVAQAQELLRHFGTVPRPDGFRIRDADGAVLHELFGPKHA